MEDVGEAADEAASEEAAGEAAGEIAGEAAGKAAGDAAGDAASEAAGKAVGQDFVEAVGEVDLQILITDFRTGGCSYCFVEYSSLTEYASFFLSNPKANPIIHQNLIANFVAICLIPLKFALKFLKLYLILFLKQKC